MGVSLEAFNLLSMQTPTLGHYPLPNLRSFCSDIILWDFAPFLRLFLNPGLTNVEIGFADIYPCLYRSTIISLIPTRDLTCLQLRFLGGEDLSLGALHNLLDEASETLRSVSLIYEELPTAVMDKLVQLPNLRCLSIQLPQVKISPPDIVFPSLEKLVVKYGEVGSWLQFLQNFPIPALRELDVSFTGSLPTYLQILGSSLLTSHVERTLVSLKCTSNNTIPLTEAGIHPLLSFKKLTKLELTGSCVPGGRQCGIELSDSIISELATALPQLISLSLGNASCQASASDVTVASLVALSTNCVDLDFLQLHFNATDIVTRGIRANPGQTRRYICKLRTLSVGSQPLPSNHDNILLVSFTILRIFPCLETISSMGRGWNQVEKYVQLFRKAPTMILLRPRTDWRVPQTTRRAAQSSNEGGEGPSS